MKNNVDRSLEERLIQDIADLKRTVSELKSNQLPNLSVAIDPNSATSVQMAVNQVSLFGGGTVVLRNGVYVLNSDLVMPARVSLVGDTAESVVLVMAGPYSVKASGNSVYSTGTISIAKGSATLTGSGTLWLSNITAGHTMVINRFPYTIASVDTDTQITLQSKYSGATLSGVTYKAAVYADRINLQNLLITGSASHGVDFSYVDNFNLDTVIVTGVAGKGFNVNDCLRGDFTLVVGDDCGMSGLYMKNSDYMATNKAFMANNVSHGIEADNISGVVFTLSPCDNNGGNGINITNSTKNNIDNSEGSNNVGHGIFLSNTDYTGITGGGADGNGSQGLMIDAESDFTNVINFEATSNGAYGIRINSANCGKSIIIGNQLSGNTSGDILDSGTGTIKANNQS